MPQGSLARSVEDFLNKYANEPWSRGKHDCVFFIHKFITEVHGKTWVDPEDYPFTDYRTAVKTYRKFRKDHGVKTFEDGLDCYFYRVPFPMEGGLVAKSDTEGLTGFSYGVTYDGYGYFVGERGLVPLELHPYTDLYWSID